MSKIQTELAEATEITPSARRNETITDQGYLKRLCVAIQDLSDADWNKLSKPAQEWYNEAADAIEGKKDIPEFPDLPQAESKSSGRRGAKKAAELEVGATVSFKTKRGKEVTGKVEEIDGDILVVNGTDYEKSTLTDLTIDGADSSATSDEPEGPVEPAVGLKVKIVTKRGKEVTGVVTDLGNDFIEIKDDEGKKQDFDKDRLESVIVVTGTSGRSPMVTAEGARNGLPKDDDKPSGRRGSSSDSKDEAGTKDDKPKRSTNGGVSVTLRIRELVVDNLQASKDKIGELLKKEGLEYKQATLDMTFGDTVKLLDILRDRKMLKE